MKIHFFCGETRPCTLQEAQEENRRSNRKKPYVGEKVAKEGVEVGKKARKKGVELGKKGAKETKKVAKKAKKKLE